MPTMLKIRGRKIPICSRADVARNRELQELFRESGELPLIIICDCANHSADADRRLVAYRVTAAHGPVAEKICDLKRYAIIEGAHAADCPYNLETAKSEPTERILAKISRPSADHPHTPTGRSPRNSKRDRVHRSESFDDYAVAIFWRTNQLSWQLANPKGQSDYRTPTEAEFFDALRQAVAESPLSTIIVPNPASTTGKRLSVGIVRWKPDIPLDEDYVPLFALEAPSKPGASPELKLWSVDGYVLGRALPMLDGGRKLVCAGPYFGVAVLTHQSMDTTRLRLFACHVSSLGAAVPRKSLAESHLLLHLEAQGLACYKPTSRADIRNIAGHIGLEPKIAGALKHLPDAIVPTDIGPVFVEVTSYSVSPGAKFPAGYDTHLKGRVSHYEALGIKVAVWVFSKGERQPELRYVTPNIPTGTSGEKAP